MKRVILLFAVLSIIIVWNYCNCRKNPVEPPFNVRQLTWTLDTLDHPDNWQTGLYSIWGSSANDVYAVGIANTTHGILWHYNGQQWRDLHISVTQGGPIAGPISLNDVFGFGKNDVWICGDRLKNNPNPPPDYLYTNLLIHRTSYHWEDIVLPDGHLLYSIWGRSPDDVWFGGAYGTLYHYNGAVVEKDSVPLEIPYKLSDPWVIANITGNETDTYMLLRGHIGRDSYFYLFQHKNNQWIIADSLFYYGTQKLWMSPSGSLYAIGETTYQRKNGIWSTFLHWNTTLSAHAIHGTSDDNLFAVGFLPNGNRAVLHYNGSDWYSYKDVEFTEDIIYYEVWTDGKEVFVAGISGGTTSIILHGK